MPATAHDNIIDLMKVREVGWTEYRYEILGMPPWTNYISPADVAQLNYIATSIKYNGSVDKKMRAIKQIMERNGFKRFAGGTNRVIFKHMEDYSFVAKVAIDRVGLKDNPAEFRAQEIIKPFCAKMFQVTPCGTVGFAERVQPIKNRAEFAIIAPDVFDVLDGLLGKYVMDDVGTQFFLNWGVTDRGPVLLDYPYIYECDPDKLFCNKEYPDGTVCHGFIDYDGGLNFLTCQRCGKRYNAVDLKKNRPTNHLVTFKGGLIPMKVKLLRNNKVIATNDSADLMIATNDLSESLHPANENLITATLRKGDKVIGTTKFIPKPVEPKEEPKDDAPLIKATLRHNGEEIKNYEAKDDTTESMPTLDSDVEPIEEEEDNSESEMKPYYMEGTDDASDDDADVEYTTEGIDLRDSDDDSGNPVQQADQSVPVIEAEVVQNDEEDDEVDYNRIRTNGRVKGNVVGDMIDEYSGSRFIR